eukprot:snap_masked-scaffold_8-processed-gene-6.32-mRNA-1 protein AED:1.00 eAED:1.00 QI:0/-1/0/0/-1/1/1/0/239
MLLSLFFKYPPKEKLREELLDKWETYASNHGLGRGLEDIFTLEVGGKEKMEEYFWNEVVLQWIKSFSKMIKSKDLQAFQRLRTYITPRVNEIASWLSYFFVCMLLCIPVYFFFRLFVYSHPKEATALQRRLSRGVVVSSHGIFIFNRKIQAYNTPDFEYSPLIWILELVLGLDHLHVIEEVAESELFVSFGDVSASGRIKGKQEDEYYFNTRAGATVFVTADLRTSVLEAQREYNRSLQ